MSTLLYATMTRQREEAPPGGSDKNDPPGVTTFVDTLAALVPAEVLALHAIFLAETTETVVNSEGESVTTITQPGALQVVFWGLILMSLIFYLVGHHRKRWDSLDWLRMLIPAFAFVGWTMAQKSTAFDAVWPNLQDVWRSIIAGFGAVLLGILVKLWADKADQEPAPAPPDPTPPDPAR